MSQKEIIKTLQDKRYARNKSKLKSDIDEEKTSESVADDEIEWWDLSEDEEIYLPTELDIIIRNNLI